MKNSILWFCRIFVGVLFIFSGLIKANDPVGFGIKLDEYYEVFASRWHWTSFLFSADWLVNSVNLQAAFLTTLEVALGIALLLGIWKQLTAWLLLLLIVFFTWLTGYSAVTGSVTDCGCFGDFIKLTPEQSFYKDLVLLFLILIVFFLRNNINPIFKPFPSMLIFLLVAGFTVWVNRTVLQHDVFFDWRPYAVGNNIPELMAIPPDAPKAVVEMTYTYKHKTSGEVKTIVMMSDEKNGEGMKELSAVTSDKNYAFVSRDDKVIDKGFVAKISDFAVSDENNQNITGSILGNKDFQLMVVASDFDHTSIEGWDKIRQVQSDAEKEFLFTFALVAENRTNIEEFRHAHQLAFPFYTGDYKVCLTIARTNPNVVLLKEGTVIDKWSWRDLPAFAEIKKEHFPDRVGEAPKPVSSEMFGVGVNVVENIRNSREPYNEFFLMDMQNNDSTLALLSDTAPVYMIFVTDMTKIGMDQWNALLPLLQKLDAAKANYFVVSASEGKLVEGMKKASKLSWNYYNSDRDVMAKILKENTGIIVIHNGTVTNKYAEGALPSADVLMGGN